MRHVEATYESFKSWENWGPYRHNPWHFHPELEITFIYQGRGVLFVGDKVLDYDKNDLILMGSNLPHEWRSDIKESPDFFSRSLAVHFKRDFPGADFYKIPEANAINHLLQQSARGIKVTDQSTKETVKEKLMFLLHAKGIERVNTLFSILNCITLSPKNELLASQSFVNSIEEGQNARMNKIYRYVMANFKNEISVDQLAGEMSMTTTSFCRFFKQRTTKSFVQFVNEIRIGYACKLLHEGNYNIAQIAFECGFGNLSNFNKQFKKIKHNTPSQYVRMAIKPRIQR